ncbi:MAG: pyrroline-5-carboxylate reductase [Candidatus Omnitrophota bacterium]
MNKKIGIIGFGNMGSSIAEQLKDNYQIFVFDKEAVKSKDAQGVCVCSDVVSLVKKSDVLILAVKPQDFVGNGRDRSLLHEIKDHVKDKLIISIAAGITTGYIEKALGAARVVRAMPNMPLRVGSGITCLTQGKFASQEDFDFAKGLFEYMGETLCLEESMMNAATAVSGSGPAYVSHFIDKDKSSFLKDFQAAAEALGFNPDDAKALVKSTYEGTISFLNKTKIAPQELIKQVTSKGGTTEAAFIVLNKGGSLVEAVKAAHARAKELSQM